MQRLKLFANSIALLSLIFLAKAVHAQSYAINIHGIPFSCVDHFGNPVPIFTDPRSAQAAAQLGGARVDVVPSGYRMSLNTQMLSQTPARSAALVFAHECGHVAIDDGQGIYALSRESDADCWAVETLADMGIIRDRYELNEAVTYVWQQGGINLRSNKRVADMIFCYDWHTR